LAAPAGMRQYASQTATENRCLITMESYARMGLATTGFAIEGPAG
jgi:hypothetical protein